MISGIIAPRPVFLVSSFIVACAKMREAFLWRRAYFKGGRDRALVKGVRRLAWGPTPLFGV